jgi:transcriptional regulator with XRE-family HTH domain
VTKTESLFIENLKRERKRAGLSQEKLAELLKMSAKYVSALEMGKRYPSPKAYQRIADILDLEPYQLLIDPDSVDRKDEKRIIEEFTAFLINDLPVAISDSQAKYFKTKLRKK